MKRITWISWNHLETLERLVGGALLNYNIHLMASQHSLLSDMCLMQTQPWVCYYVYCKTSLRKVNAWLNYG